MIFPNQNFKKTFSFFLVFLLLCIVVRSSLMNWYRVYDQNMYPSISQNEVLFANLIAYDIRFPFTKIIIYSMAGPKRGDIVVYRALTEHGKPRILRVVGIPGDYLGYSKGQLIINNQLVHTSPFPEGNKFLNDYIHVKKIEAEKQPQFSILQEQLGDISYTIMIADSENIFSQDQTVHQNSYYLIGDNRSTSYMDSRNSYVGNIAREDILGRIFKPNLLLRILTIIKW